MQVLLAPDSFKGTATAVEVCRALRSGWLAARSADDVRMLPFADGGEGTLAAVEAAVPGAGRRDAGMVTGPHGSPVAGEYLMLPDGTAVVELAQASGLPLMPRLDPLRATSRGTGEVLRAAVASGARRVALGLGGSASSDGGAGILRALGLKVLDDAGREVPEGALGLLQASELDHTGLVPPPPDGVVLVTDVDNPLLGPFGAAAVFGPQMGGGPDDVHTIEEALRHWAHLLGADTDLPGGGAAGGVGAGLAATWSAVVRPGSAWVADLVELDRMVAASDLVVTGEGCFDDTSLRGKAVSHVLDAAARQGVPAAVVAGSLRRPLPPGTRGFDLTVLAGSADAALSDAPRWLRVAGEVLAHQS